MLSDGNNLNSQKRSSVRSRMIWLVFIIYWLLIFEGALRKWGLPQLEEMLFFVRAPFTLWLYGMAFYHRAWPRPNLFLIITYLFALLSALLAILQMVIGEYTARHLILVGYGWYNYFFYIPLAFLIGEQFRLQDIHRFIRHTLWIALISAPLVLMQFYSPPNAPINTGFALEIGNQFAGLRSALGYIRPSGLFTSALGQNMFALGALVFIAYVWLERTSRGSIPVVLRWAGTVAVFCLIGLSQSRGLFIQSAFFLLITLLGAFLSRQLSKVRRIVLWFALIVMFFVIVWPLALPTSYEVFVLRWSSAWKSEAGNFEYGTWGRIVYTFSSFLLYLEATPILGYLLGMGSNAAMQLSWVQLPKAYYEWSGYGAWTEQSFTNHIVELGPVLGLSFIAFRIAVGGWIIWRSVAGTYHSHNPLPVLLAGYAGILLVAGQITSQGSVNGFCWIFFGLSLAAVRLSRQQSEEGIGNGSESVVSKPRQP